MPKLEQRTLKNDVYQAEKDLRSIASEQGRSTPAYQNALRRFARLWSVLKMTRSHSEFFREVSSSNNESERVS